MVCQLDVSLTRIFLTVNFSRVTINSGLPQLELKCAVAHPKPVVSTLKREARGRVFLFLFFTSIPTISIYKVEVNVANRFRFYSSRTLLRPRFEPRVRTQARSLLWREKELPFDLQHFFIFYTYRVVV